jgi:hypothetical protein
LDREARRRESADLIAVATAVMVQVLGVLIIVDRVSGAFGATAVAGRSEYQIARLSDVLRSRGELLRRREGPDDFQLKRVCIHPKLAVAVHEDGGLDMLGFLRDVTDDGVLFPIRRANNAFG